MLLNLNSRRRIATGFSLAIFAVVVILAFTAAATAQTTISTGSIQGTITDPSGAVVNGAQITITNKATGQVINTSTSSSGTYASGALIPADYVVRVEAKGFSTTELPVSVQVGVTAPGNVKLQVGEASQVVEVQGSQIRVNTEQGTVQGVLTAQQIDQLPINGRNFLDLAQLEPGVQIQDGTNFDPTKNGFSSISFGGRFGRTARIEVDGVDISDETVGTTTQNISPSAIEEFQISQSSLDLSTELTSSGAVNIVTRSGTNDWHGEGFYLFRDKRAGFANFPGGQDLPFQRNHYGGRFGGPIWKDKVFFFLNAEHIKQDAFTPVTAPDPFTALTGGFPAPFRETETLGRLDWQIRPGWRLFYRFSYEQNRSVASFGSPSYEPFANVNNAPVHAIGTDFNTGSYTHSIRWAYTKFRNGIADAVTGSSVFNPAPEITLSFAPGVNFFCVEGSPLCTGPNFLAPQKTYQSDKQLKYDGSKTLRSHILRYGVSYNRILGGGFAAFFGISPSVVSLFTDANKTFADNSCGTGAPCFPGGRANPLNYPVDNLLMGNGLGFFTERPGFGLPAGGEYDSRFAWYVGDSWKIKPNFTLTYGLRYVRDTGRADSDLPPVAELNSAPFSNIQPGLGNRVHQPNLNFAPQLGIAWDPAKNGKTVFRGGIGLFYENAVFNNVLFDRPGRLPSGLFFGTGVGCFLDTPIPIPLPDGSGTIDTSSICGQPVGNVASVIAADQTQFQQATIAAGPAANGNFIGNAFYDSSNANGITLFAPNYRSARSVQMNFGVQRELRQGMVLSADYVRNVATHTLLSIDVNRTGDSRFLNIENAVAAINATIGGCGPVTQATASAGIACYMGANATASISDFAANGLDSTVDLTGGSPCLTPCAFAGIEPNVGFLQMLFPTGRSVYNGLQMALKQDVKAPFPGARHMNLQVSYALSRYISQANDGDFINNALDQRNPVHFTGPTSLDRTHQFSFGGVFDLPLALRLSFGAHFSTALPRTMTLPQTGSPGEIFRTDVDGDGQTGDPLPGTNIGAFGRSVKTGDLNKVLSAYNGSLAGTSTPAGQALVDAGLVTQSQLSQLNAIQQPIPLAPAGEVGLGAFRSLDMKLAWVYKIRERFSIEPSFSAYNVLNFANFDGAGGRLSGELNGQAGSINGTTPANRTNRIGPGTGTFSFGAPRQLEFGLRLTF